MISKFVRMDEKWRNPNLKYGCLQALPYIVIGHQGDDVGIEQRSDGLVPQVDFIGRPLIEDVEVIHAEHHVVQHPLNHLQFIHAYIHTYI